MEMTVVIDGVRLCYTVQGAGTAALLMHGWGCDHTTLQSIERLLLSMGLMVYSVDFPGFGGSDEPPGVWGVEQYTGLMETFAAREGIEQPVLIGHSFGGRVGLLYASRNAVRKLVLIDAAGVKPRRGLKYYVKVYTYKAAKRVLPLLLGRERGGAALDRYRSRAGSSDYSQSSPRMRAVLSRVVNEDLKHVMPSIGCPTLLIWGKDDTATPLRDAKIMERLIPDAGLVAMEGAGHYSFLDRPYQTAAVLRSFLADDAKNETL